MRGKVAVDGTIIARSDDADSGSGSAESGSGSAVGGSDSGSDELRTDGDGTGSLGGDNGTGNGTGERKRRGRPKGSVNDLVGEISGPTLAKRRGPAKGNGRKNGPDLGVLIDTTVVGLFGLVAVATAHEHWLKERDDVIPITGPLKAWVDQLDSKTLKKIEKNLAPTLFVIGCATVVGPDVVMEMRERAKSRNRNAVPKPTPGFRTGYAPPGSSSEGAGEYNGNAGSGWASSIPASRPSGFEVDA